MLKMLHLNVGLWFWCIPIVLIGYLLWQYTLPLGVLELTYTPGQMSRTFRPLWPYDRYTIAHDGALAYTHITKDTVMLRLQVVRAYFHNADMSIRYRTSVPATINVGLRSNTSDWAWNSKQLQPTANVDEWGFTNARVHFALTPANYRNNNIEFIFNAPELFAQGGELDIASIKLTLTKPPLTLRTLITRLTSFL